MRLHSRRDYLFQNIFSLLKGNSSSLAGTPYLPLSQPLATSNVLSILLVAGPHFLQQLSAQGTQVGVTLVTDRLVAVVLLGELAEGGLDDATLQMKHQAQGGLFEYCDLGECSHPPAVCPQMSDTAGWVGCPPFLDFNFNTLSGVTGLYHEGGGLTWQGLHKDLRVCICWGGCLPPH